MIQLSPKLSAICDKLGATEYISGPSGKDYLDLSRFNCKVTFFEPKVENHYSSIQFFKNDKKKLRSFLHKIGITNNSLFYRTNIYSKKTSKRVLLLHKMIPLFIICLEISAM